VAELFRGEDVQHVSDVVAKFDHEVWSGTRRVEGS
jgi:hypothetical protein